MLRVREELPEDIDAIRQVNIQAFGRTQEADLVDELRRNCSCLLSLVGLEHEEIVGHVLFSPVVVNSEDVTIRGMGLAPLAVRPRYQSQGIGSKLTRVGITKLKRRCSFIMVLGHPKYYPRFGFERASHCGIRSNWEVPDDAFMILILDKSDMQGVSGVVKYRPEFAESIQAARPS